MNALAAKNATEMLNERAVKQLLAAHRQRVDQPLVLAIRFNGDVAEDIHLLEVLENFPGEDEDELFETDFEPSADLVMLGKLHLVLASPGQMRTALNRRDPLVASISGGRVVHSDGSKTAKALCKELGL
jgi:hypothetical protein